MTSLHLIDPAIQLEMAALPNQPEWMRLPVESWWFAPDPLAEGHNLLSTGDSRGVQRRINASVDAVVTI
jgi:hypothetical protein